MSWILAHLIGLLLGMTLSLLSVNVVKSINPIICKHSSIRRGLNLPFSFDLIGKEDQLWCNEKSGETDFAINLMNGTISTQTKRKESGNIRKQLRIQQGDLSPFRDFQVGHFVRTSSRVSSNGEITCKTNSHDVGKPLFAVN